MVFGIYLKSGTIEFDLFNIYLLNFLGKILV